MQQFAGLRLNTYTAEWAWLCTLRYFTKVWDVPHELYKSLYDWYNPQQYIPSLGRWGMIQTKSTSFRNLFTFILFAYLASFMFVTKYSISAISWECNLHTLVSCFIQYDNPVPNMDVCIGWPRACEMQYPPTLKHSAWTACLIARAPCLTPPPPCRWLVHPSMVHGFRVLFRPIWNMHFPIMATLRWHHSTVQ